MPEARKLQKKVFSFGPGYSQAAGVYDRFKSGRDVRRRELGSKGDHLHRDAAEGQPVPPGFSVVAAVGRHYLKVNEMPAGVAGEIDEALEGLEGDSGRKLGDPTKPLLVSVRSGARDVMPGMMDTVVNVGMSREVAEALEHESGNPWFAWDTYRRFMDSMVESCEHSLSYGFKSRIRDAVEKVERDQDVDGLRALLLEAEGYPKCLSETGLTIPTKPRDQLDFAMKSAFRSWNNKRAVEYRKYVGIPHWLGTPVTVQRMVFGNFNNDAMTLLAFSRNPHTGEGGLWGEYLRNAQGTDLVGGTRTPLQLERLREENPVLYGRLWQMVSLLERRNRDCVDTEITVDANGNPWLLQNNPRSFNGPVRIMADVNLVEEGIKGKAEAVRGLPPGRVRELALKTRVLSTEGCDVIHERGLSACIGAAVGRVAFTAKRAIEMSKEGPVILVRNDTVPDDCEGMMASKGLLTARGGMSCHAAVVARASGIPAIVASNITIDSSESRKFITESGAEVKEGDWISLVIESSVGDSSGVKVYVGQIQVESFFPDQLNPYLAKLDSWRKG